MKKIPPPKSLAARDGDVVLLVGTMKGLFLFRSNAARRRWEAKGGDSEDGRRRMSAQIAADAARTRAHDVLVNDGSLDALRAAVGRLYASWTGSEGRRP